MGIILKQFSSSYHEKVYSHLQELVQKHQQSVDGFLNDKLSVIKLIAHSYDPAYLNQNENLSALLATIRNEFDPVFVDLGVIDNTGTQISYAGPYELVKAQYANADWYENAKSQEHFISDVFLGLRGQPHFIVSVKYNFGTKNYILKATIDFKSFNTVVENLRVGKSGFAFILNRKGELQTQTHSGFNFNKVDLEHLTKATSRVKDNVRYLEKKDTDGEKYIYLSTYLKNEEWLLVFRQKLDDALSELINLQMITLLISFLGGISIISISILLARRMVNQIALADREKEMMNQQVIETGKLASIGELAAGIAHEINNPVAIMVEEAGWIQDLLDDKDCHNDENMAELIRALRQINTQGKRCKEITHKLLSFARKTDSTIQDVNINDVVGDLAGLFAQRAKYAKVEIITKLEENLPTLRISESELQQVFLNIINNALDAMDAKGGVLEISSFIINTQVVIRFKDNGPGIHPDHLARVFDPFFTTKPVGKGTGLGLSICYGIVHKMGGEIDVKSAIGIGTTFEIRFPIHS